MTTDDQRRDDQATPPSGYQVPEESDQPPAKDEEQTTQRDVATWKRGAGNGHDAKSEADADDAGGHARTAVTFEPPEGGHDDLDTYGATETVRQFINRAKD